MMHRRWTSLAASVLALAGVLLALSACSESNKSANITQNAALASKVSDSNDTLVVWFYNDLVTIHLSKAQVDSFANANGLIELSCIDTAAAAYLFQIDRSVVPPQVPSETFAQSLKLNNLRLVRYAHVQGEPEPTPPVSTEQLIVWFNEAMSDSEVYVFAGTNGLTAIDPSSSAGRKVFVFALDRTVVPLDTTASMYAEKLKHEYPDLIYLAGADRPPGAYQELGIGQQAFKEGKQ